MPDSIPPAYKFMTTWFLFMNRNESLSIYRSWCLLFHSLFPHEEIKYRTTFCRKQRWIDLLMPKTMIVVLKYVISARWRITLNSFENISNSWFEWREKQSFECCIYLLTRFFWFVECCQDSCVGWSRQLVFRLDIFLKEKRFPGDWILFVSCWRCQHLDKKWKAPSSGKRAT